MSFGLMKLTNTESQLISFHGTFSFLSAVASFEPAAGRRDLPRGLCLLRGQQRIFLHLTGDACNHQCILKLVYVPVRGRKSPSKAEAHLSVDAFKDTFHKQRLDEEK